MGRKSRFASKALDFAYDRYIGNDKAKAEAFEAELANADVARKIYDLRTKAGLTQSGLAKLVGTSTSVISRLEDGDYEGHSLAMLRRIASAFKTKGMEIALRLCQKERRPSASVIKDAEGLSSRRDDRPATCDHFFSETPSRLGTLYADIALIKEI